MKEMIKMRWNWNRRKLRNLEAKVPRYYNIKPPSKVWIRRRTNDTLDITHPAHQNPKFPRKQHSVKPNPIRTHFNLDTDNDFVKDHLDCKPFNRMFQHYGPSEFPMNNKEDLHELYKQLQRKAIKKYDNQKELEEIAWYITKIKLREKSYEPKKMWNRAARDLPTYQFETGFYMHPFIPADIFEIYDKGHDNYIYVDVTGYIGKYSSVEIDKRFQKGWGSGLKNKLILVIDATDKERFGRSFPDFVQYVYENEYK